MRVTWAWKSAPLTDSRQGNSSLDLRGALVQGVRIGASRVSSPASGLAPPAPPVQ